MVDGGAVLESLKSTKKMRNHIVTWSSALFVQCRLLLLTMCTFGAEVAQPQPKEL